MLGTTKLSVSRQENVLIIDPLPTVVKVSLGTELCLGATAVSGLYLHIYSGFIYDSVKFSSLAMCVFL